jgi:dimethylargininase
MYTKAIVKKPCRNITKGLTKSNLGVPDYNNALIQHQNYISALEKCGLEITILDADNYFPDSVFIEDIALLTPFCAIITNPGAISRKGEIFGIEAVLEKFYSDIEYIKVPGTLDGGDIMNAGTHYYIGLSERTNYSGIQQLQNILDKYKLSSTVIPLKNVLHLKSGVAYLENNNLVASGEFLTKDEFNKFNILEIKEQESYAANCIWINGRVIIPEGFPDSKNIIEKAGYTIIEIDVSEFRKVDGGLSCLSLRF